MDRGQPHEPKAGLRHLQKFSQAYYCQSTLPFQHIDTFYFSFTIQLGQKTLLL